MANCCPPGGYLWPVDAALIAGYINAMLKYSHKKSPFPSYHMPERGFACLFTVSMKKGKKSTDHQSTVLTNDLPGDVTGFRGC